MTKRKSIKIMNDMYLMPLTQGKYAMVDQYGYNVVKNDNWYIANGYAVKSDYSCGYVKTIRMHRIIMPTPENMIIDHVNMNKLDNRTKNLRVCSRSENAMNCKPRRVGSKYKGISLNKINKKWSARITIKGKQKHIGYFENEEDAARAYNEAALNYYGEFARLNCI